ncbi:MAG TPA: carboxypeptidase regulatory-like domain-containing protein [Candidatus Saccharimonadales bacterium]|nr:carboxypeptidase regulatory-like domain-containing protein [Candidatus Saccharimonadales bacterium]
MKFLKIVLGVVCLVVPCANSRAGSITGRVQAHGKEIPNAEGGTAKYGSRKYSFVERVDYSSMHDFIVYVEGTALRSATPPEKPVQVVTTKKITQKGAMFTPNVLPVEVGTTVEWPNHDEIFHNVFSMSEPKPFDLGLYKDPQVKRVTFDKPGRVEVFCSIHSSMNCTILVLDNPFYAATDENGKYSIQNVPGGVYKLTAWHKRLPMLTQEITVPAVGELKMDFKLGITNLPKY